MNQSDRNRLERIKAMPCIACELEGVQQPNATEAHHIVDKGYRRLSGGHSATIPLCRHHHRGVPAYGVNASEMACAFGPSLALQKKAFVARYGDERSLLAKVDAKLERAA